MSRSNDNDEWPKFVMAALLCVIAIAFGLLMEKWRAGIWAEEMQKHGVVAPGGAK